MVRTVKTWRTCLVVLSFLGACGTSNVPSGTVDMSIGAGNCATGCLRGYQCMSNVCMLNPSGLWKITVTSGTISTQNSAGSAWDTLGGAPDPMVCLTVNGARSCTTTKQDTFTPSWNESFAAATATALLSGVTVELVDVDIASNDAICPTGVVPVTQQNFVNGTWGSSCAYGSFQSVLTAQ